MVRRRRVPAKPTVTLPTGERPLLGRPAAAAYLDIKPDTLKKWTARRRIAFVRIGGRIKYRRDDLDAFIAANRVASS
jgi:excisionase family DNA binding protein